MNNSALGIIFRIPEFGKVKKRLAAQIGDSEALKAYASMLHITLERTSTLKDIDIYGFYRSESEVPQPKAGASLKLNSLITLPQQGKNLDDIMLNAFEQLFNIGYHKVLLIGADSPDLPLHYIREAISMLNFYDLGIGPTEDGGFYLIGSRKPLSNQIFQGIDWGSSTVLKDTLNNVQKLKINYFLLNTWYDIDDKEGLDRWKNKLTKSLKNKYINKPYL
jgi:rSAM/selenodomain-associated transferase 1